MRPLPPKPTPLKFVANATSSKPTTPTLSKSTSPSIVKSVTAAATPAGSRVQPASQPESISSPHELTSFVESILNDLEKKFDDMSTQVLDRMSQMSSRIDALELSMRELLNDDLGGSSSLRNDGSESPTLSVSGRQSSASLGRN